VARQAQASEERLFQEIDFFRPPEASPSTYVAARKEPILRMFR
jgi:hypothetical protein